MGNVRRVYVEKKPAFAVQAKELAHEARAYLGISRLAGVRVLMRYDVERISDEVFDAACQTVFSEPPVDLLYRETFPMGEGDRTFSVEYLPGQFDQRADSAEQCVRLLNEEEQPLIRTATTYVISGDLTEAEFAAVKSMCINPVDSRETGVEKPDTLAQAFAEPADVATYDGFSELEEGALRALYDSLGLAMTFADFQHIQRYFRDGERRDPTVTEIRVLDTYWSDHCRHTTFSTELRNITFGEGDYKAPIQETYRQYLADRQEVHAGKEGQYVCLMDLALTAMRRLKKEGKLGDQEESEEINACSIVVPVTVDGQAEEWLVNFKNETHNHPTEIEPFGGAATCLGGAIRDPLSGRTYVYQAMRVTGAADPTVSVKETLKGKLPQKKLVRQAAKGYSSYGNQIGLATGYVKEIYHPNYVAKRMEIGAVLGAAPKKSVRRLSPAPGDAVVLLGGRTGRDGIGGATGSSKSHTEASITVCGAEVQKGNPPTERKIQRMFRRPEVSRLIKKCNDFGAGGVAVAIGELADGLRVNLDLVPKKYAGLDGTEIAISESQERMAVVLDAGDVQAFLGYAAQENLEAVEVAQVTEEARLVLLWRGKEIVNLSRAFLATNGAHQEAEVFVEIPARADRYFQRREVADVREAWLLALSDLNGCSQKGLVEMFDSSIGAGSVLMPYGGTYQMTETQAMVAKLPVAHGKTDAATVMSYGFDPYLSSWSPYHGAVYAVLDSVAKIVASGADFHKIRLTFQEYFCRMDGDARRWGQPFAALLGAYRAQIALGLPAIGGKDSMSGSFQDIDVPPTLVSFAVDMARASEILTPELKKPGSRLVLLRIPKDPYDLPDFEAAKDQYAKFYADAQAGKIVSAYALDGKGLALAASKMAFGNRLGVKIEHAVDARDLFAAGFGDIVAEVPDGKVGQLSITYTVVGEVLEEPVFTYRDVRIPADEAQKAWTGTLEEVFPTKSGERGGTAFLGETGCGPATLCPENFAEQDFASDPGDDASLDGRSVPGNAASLGSGGMSGDGASRETAGCASGIYCAEHSYICKHKVARPRVFIPVFPGTNCEYDSAQAFARAGADVDVKVFRTLTAQDIRDSVRVFAEAIGQAQILMFPGGFSAGDEPDGSAKFFATAFRNEKLKEAVTRLLRERDGLVLGICNGFQALIKLGLVPHGEIAGQREDSPTLTYNTLGRHISRMVYTKVVSNKSPWLRQAELGGTYCSPASHGEGRFAASAAWIQKLFANGQVATQYVTPDGALDVDNEEWNVNGSHMAIEGITSADGRVFGKMAHAERKGESVAANIRGEQDLKIFESGVAYFL